MESGSTLPGGYDSDDELDWEEVEVTAQHLEITLNPTQKAEVKGKGKEVAKPAAQRKGPSPEERLKRINCHKIHTITLITNAGIRNQWINDDLLRARLLSLTPLPLQNGFAAIHKSRIPEAARRGRMFQAAMTRLVEWWIDFFEVTPVGHLRNRTYESVHEGLRDEGLIVSKEHQEPSPSTENSPDDVPLTTVLGALKGLKSIDIESLQSTLNDDGEFIRSPKSLMKHALMRSGSRDTSAQLFTSLCRSLDIPARLVVSIQSVPWQSGGSEAKPKAKPKGKVKASDAKATTNTSKPLKKPPKAAASKPQKNPSKAAASKPRLRSSTKVTRSKSNPKPISASKAKKAAQLQEKSDSGSSDDDSAFSESDTSSSSGFSSKNQATSSPKSRKRPTKQPPNGPPPPSPQRATTALSAPPVFWTEVYSKGDAQWLPVDPVRGLVNKRKVFDPSQLPLLPSLPSIYRTIGVSTPQKKAPSRPPYSPKTIENRMVYVLAFEEDGYARDVTRRYAREYAVKVAKMQGQGRGKGRLQWWEGVLGMIHRPYRLARDDAEDEELEAAQLAEGMPTTIAGFKDHPLYVLTRHLHVNQVIHPEPPDTPELGRFRDEPVYPRSAVVELKTSENWLRSEGRVVKAGCQPLKTVKARVSTVNKLRAIEALKEAGAASGAELMQGLYAWSQTEPFVPPPIVDGVIPKNNYGNIDLYVPSMLPAGGAHVPLRGAWKIAKKLGFDYAEAVTGFHFKSRRAMPVIEGVVIAAEHEAAYAEAEQEAEKKALIQRKERVIKRWKRLIQGLQIRERLHSQYKDGTLEIQIPAPDKGGGFLIDADDIVQPYLLPRNTHPVLPSYPSHLIPSAPHAKALGQHPEGVQETAEPLVLGTMDLDSEIEDDPPLTLEIPRFVPVSMQELAEKHDTQVVASGLDTSDPIDIPVAPLSNPPLDDHAKPEDEDLPGSARPKRTSRRSTRVIANGADVNTPGTPRQTSPPKPDSPSSPPFKPKAVASSSSDAHPNTKRRLSDVTVEVVITESPPSKKRKAKATTNSTVPTPTRVLRPRTSKSQSQLRR